MNPFMVHTGGFMVSRRRLNDKPVRKTWFAARPLRSHRRGELERSRPRAIGLMSQRSWGGPPEFPIAGFLAMECSPQDLATQFLS
jgi:hypothetical protein